MRSGRTAIWCSVLYIAVGLTHSAACQESTAVLGRLTAAQVRTTGMGGIISVHLDHVPLSAAIRQVARLSGVDVAFSEALLPSRVVVTVALDGVTAYAALLAILQGTGIALEVSPTGLPMLVRSGDTDAALLHRPFSAPFPQGTGTIAGHVTDGALKSPLSGVAVRIEGTALGATANADGKYAITGVAPGSYHVTARRVGYQPLARDVTVGADQTVTLDFALIAAATRLDEVVTTAVGEQRRYQVGNDISTINADSIAPTAPITSLTDLISARAPGVQVLETSGMTGSGEAIRIEGLTSLVLQNDPILIVDGVREDNSAGGDVAAYLSPGYVGSEGTHPTPTRLNDIDFSDIESIDILKGPAASTEYGTDAANGVIVITTKHGSAGAPQWKASAEQTESDIPETFPNYYYSWGHTTDGNNTPVNCRLNEPYGGMYAVFGAPYDLAQTAGTCVTDSVTQENPLNNPATSIFGTGNRGKYDLSVGGGSDAVRYFVAGGLSNETGVIQMPSLFRELADTADIGLPSAAFNPNSEQQRSVRVNTAIKLGSTADLSVTASYLSTYQETPDAQELYFGIVDAPALNDPAHFYGYALGGSVSSYTPLAELSELGQQNTDRVTGGLTANWRPTGWFVGHATVGIDHGSQTNEELTYPLANPAYQLYTPFLGLADLTTDVYSVDLRGTATASLTHGLRSVTSGGLQMVDTRLAGQSGYTQSITVTNLTLNGATGPGVTQLATRQATLGGYGEEQLSVSDRLFVTGALRIDAGSGFGGAYSVAAYPKASVSWLAVNQGPTTVRVRGAFGEAGVQPMNGAALQLYAPTVATIGTGGAPVSASTVSSPGNSALQPERTDEFEGGVDVGGWGTRVSAELTGYSKTTHDALVNVNLGETLGSLLYQENIGEVRNTGVEGSVTVGLVQSRSVTWDVAVNASVNHNTLLSLAPGVTAQTLTAYPTTFRQAVGYPLYGIWAQQVTYADANHDGIIEPDEVTVADSASYMGSSLPTQEASVSTHLGLFRGAVTLSGLVDYRGGYKIASAVDYYSDNAGNTLGTNDPTAPLALQARAWVNGGVGFNSLDAEDGSFVRVREVAVTYAVPRSLTRALRMQSISLTGAVRNLALWTRYSGVDPEVSNTFSSILGGHLESSQTTAAYQVNNDVRNDTGTVPLARYWVLRLNVGL